MMQRLLWTARARQIILVINALIMSHPRMPRHKQSVIPVKTLQQEMPVKQQYRTCSHKLVSLIRTGASMHSNLQLELKPLYHKATVVLVSMLLTCCPVSHKECLSFLRVSHKHQICQKCLAAVLDLSSKALKHFVQFQWDQAPLSTAWTRIIPRLVWLSPILEQHQMLEG